MSHMKIQTNGFHSLEQVQNEYLNKSRNLTESAAKQPDALSFQDILEQASGAKKEVRFSKHAMGRLNTRNIELTDGQMERLNEGTKKAQAKGIRDSLVLVDSLAFIVNVPSSTVVTAMEQSEAQENIFTNIDGAVII